MVFFGSKSRPSFRVRGPDADGLVWLVYEQEGRRGLVNLGAPGERDADTALRLRDDEEKLGEELGHLAKAPG